MSSPTANARAPSPTTAVSAVMRYNLTKGLSLLLSMRYQGNTLAESPTTGLVKNPATGLFDGLTAALRSRLPPTRSGTSAASITGSRRGNTSTKPERQRKKSLRQALLQSRQQPLRRRRVRHLRHLLDRTLSRIFFVAVGPPLSIRAPCARRAGLFSPSHRALRPATSGSMRVLVAFDKFKDSLTAQQACDLTAHALAWLAP